MGTNYYLKCKMNPKNMLLAATCGYSNWYGYDNEIKVLSNGYVWKNTYYPDIEDLDRDYYCSLHIGKSSAGWHFSLCTYPELGIESIDDWLELFKDNEIIDECDCTVKLETMMNTITKRDTYSTKSEEEELADLNSLHSKLGMRTYSSYDEFLKDNHASRGLNGLLAHNYGDFRRTEGTYDITTDWNFS